MVPTFLTLNLKKTRLLNTLRQWQDQDPVLFQNNKTEYKLLLLFGSLGQRALMPICYLMSIQFLKTDRQRIPKSPTPWSKSVVPFLYCCVNSKRLPSIFFKSTLPYFLVSTNKHFQAATNGPHKSRAFCLFTKTLTQHTILGHRGFALCLWPQSPPDFNIILTKWSRLHQE